jgi:hypothetical protein
MVGPGLNAPCVALRLCQIIQFGKDISVACPRSPCGFPEQDCRVMTQTSVPSLHSGPSLRLVVFNPPFPTHARGA